MSDTLPPSWRRVKLGDVIDYGKAERAEPADIPSGAWVLELEDIEKDSSRLLQRLTLDQRQSKSTKNRFRRGDVLYGKLRPYLNKVLIADQDGYCTTEILPLSPNEIVDGRYLFYWLKHPEFLDYVTAVSHGLNMPRLGTEAGKQAPFVLAPLAEQQRIADKLDALLARVDACRARLGRASAVIKRFRQAVLAAAVSGRLTEDWREENADTEPAQLLLKRIRSTRLANQDRGRKHHAHSDEAENYISSLLDAPEQHLPATWVATNIGAIGTVSNGSTPSRKVPSYWDGDIPWVSSGEVQNCIITETRERISHEGYKNSSVRLLPSGTVLLAMIGEGKTRGQSAILDIAACINQNIAAVVIDHGMVESKYLWYWFQGEYEATRQAGSGSGPQALNCQRVRDLPFTLPPLAEQHEIVRRVETLFAYADRLEARLAAAQARVAQLTPSLLAKAFRGEM